MRSPVYLFRVVRNLFRDLAWSIRYREFGIWFFWKKKDRCPEQGYSYTYYDGPRSVIWLGPMTIWWMGDTFEQDEWLAQYREKAK